MFWFEVYENNMQRISGKESLIIFLNIFLRAINK